MGVCVIVSNVTCVNKKIWCMVLEYFRACACDACVFGSNNLNNVNVIAEALDDVKGVRALDVER